MFLSALKMNRYNLVILAFVATIGVSAGRYTNIGESFGFYTGNVGYKITMSALECARECRSDDCDGYAVSQMSDGKFSCVYEMNPTFLPHLMKWEVYGGKELMWHSNKIFTFAGPTLPKQLMIVSVTARPICNLCAVLY